MRKGIFWGVSWSTLPADVAQVEGVRLVEKGNTAPWQVSITTKPSMSLARSRKWIYLMNDPSQEQLAFDFDQSSKERIVRLKIWYV